MRILGIDSSLTATGICSVDLYEWPVSAPPRAPDEPVLHAMDSFTVGAPKPDPKDKSKRAMARRVSALLDQIERVLVSDGVGPLPDLVAMEELAYGAKGDSAWVLPWVWGEIIRLCEKHDVPLIIVNQSCVKKYATGVGNAKKDVVMLAAAKRYPESDISDNNEADATVCVAIGCRYLGFPIDRVPKLNLEFMDKVHT